MYNIAAVNAMSAEKFIDTFSHIFEHSPWVAEQSYKLLPVTDFKNLHELMVSIVTKSPQSAQLQLLREHPELAGRFKEKVALTENSAKEQSQAGLNSCTPEQLEQLLQFNEEYNMKFEFPFIVAVKGLQVDDIISRMARRVSNSYEQEFDEALQQVYRIAEFRLKDLVE